MNNYNWKFISIVLLLCLNFVSSGANNRVREGILDLRGQNIDKIGEIGFNGEWEFYWQELLYPNDFKLSDKNPVKFVSVPSLWNRYEIEGQKLSGIGFATYRMRILKDTSFEELAFKFSSIGTAFSLFINDTNIYNAGKVGHTKETSIPGYKPGTVSFSTKSDTLNIIIQVSNFHYSKGGIWSNYNKFGKQAVIEKSWNRKIQLALLIIGALLIVAFYHIGLFFINRDFRYMLYFSIFCLIMVVRTLTTNETFILNIFPNLNWVHLVKIEYLTLIVGTFIFSLFFYKFFQAIYSLSFLKYITAICAIFFITISFTEPIFFTRFLLVFQINILIGCIYIIVITIQAINKKNKYALIALIGFIILFLAIINDILYAQRIIQTTFLSSLAFMGFVFSQALMLSAHFSGMYEKTESLAKSLEESNLNLEKLVDDRTVKIKKQHKLLTDQSNLIQLKNRSLEDQNKEILLHRDEQQKKNNLVLKQKRQITSSIEYASRIQTAVIEKNDEIHKVAPNNFILFHPKDIVSGDFYWFKEIEIDQKKYKIASVIDCTGHGVPGALMSMVGALLLNKISSDLNKVKPKASDILDRLRVEVKTLLKQYANEKSLKDGMDMSLFIIDYELMEIQFAGAHNPLYIIRNTNGLPSNQLEEYSGDDLSIGSYEKSYESFTNLHIPINKGDLLYLFSDGYYDQFGGEDSKKLSKDNFKNVLINNAWLPLEQQKFRLEKTLLNWRGNYEQIDDITVIGVRI